eukprot:340001_1
MSNIHSLSDLQHNQTNQPEKRPFPQIPQGSAGANSGSITAVNGYHTNTSLRDILAPNYTPKSFIFIISIIQICLFITELILSRFMKDPISNQFPPSNKAMKFMGAKHLSCIQKGEIFRFFTSSLLHAGFFHILSNLFTQSNIGYTAEKHWGTNKMIFIYFMSSCGATLLSCIGHPDSVSVGASGALLGIIGVYISWMLLNWNNKEIFNNPRRSICNIVVWLLLIFLIGNTSNNIDNYGHLGGWITGIFMG